MMRFVLALSLVVFLGACSPRFTFNRQGLEIPTAEMTNQAVKDITSIAVGILTEDNFVVVHANSDVGLVTTEWGGLYLGGGANARIRFTINILRDLKTIKIRPSVEYKGMMGGWIDANGQPIKKAHQEKINNYLTSVGKRLYDRFVKALKKT